MPFRIETKVEAREKFVHIGDLLASTLAIW